MDGKCGEAEEESRSENKEAKPTTHLAAQFPMIDSPLAKLIKLEMRGEILQETNKIQDSLGNTQKSQVPRNCKIQKKLLNFCNIQK